MTAPAAELVLLHGDTWDTCPWFYVAISGAAPEGWPEGWTVHAEARQRSTEPALFTWQAAADEPEDSGILVAAGVVALKSGAKVPLPAITLRLRPKDWGGTPTRWSGYLELELTRGPADDPDDRRTVVRRRPFRVTPDLVT